MKSLVNLAVLGASVALMYGCAEDVGTGGGSPSNKSLDNPAADLPTRLAGDVYYTGYDGIDNTKFSVFVRTRRTLELDDDGPDRVVDLNQTSIDIPQATVTAMIDELALVEEVDAERREDLERRLASATRWVITPRKPGIALIKATRTSRRSGNVRPDSVWYTPELRTVVVQNYASDQVQIGSDRYNNAAGACIGCHGDTSITGAPSHQIGRVGQISDADAMTWISAGEVGNRKFTQNGFANPSGHSWSFTSDYEKASTVAYLRTQQTKDLTELAQLLFDEVIADAKADATN